MNEELSASTWTKHLSIAAALLAYALAALALVDSTASIGTTLGYAIAIWAFAGLLARGVCRLVRKALPQQYVNATHVVMTIPIALLIIHGGRTETTRIDHHTEPDERIKQVHGQIERNARQAGLSAVSDHDLHRMHVLYNKGMESLPFPKRRRAIELFSAEIDDLSMDEYRERMQLLEDALSALTEEERRHGFGVTSKHITFGAGTHIFR